MTRYKVGFLIPSGAIKRLGDDGWEFDSDKTLPDEIEEILKSSLLLTSSSADHASYDGEKLKADVFKDANGAIENVYLRFYGDDSPSLPRFLDGHKALVDVEFFKPQ